MRSRKLAVLTSALKPPKIHGDPDGDLLVVGWGSTLGAIEEAVDRLRGDGLQVSSLHLRFLSPLEPGLREIFSHFKKVVAVEINYSDEPGQPYITEQSRRYSQLAQIAAGRTLCMMSIAGRAFRADRFRPELLKRSFEGDSPDRRMKWSV